MFRTLYQQTTISNDQTTIISSPITYRETSFEHCLTYERTDGTRIEMVLTHLPDLMGEGASEPTFTIAAFQLQDNPNLEQCELPSLSMEETRLLASFLARQEVADYLDESEE